MLFATLIRFRKSVIAQICGSTGHKTPSQFNHLCMRLVFCKLHIAARQVLDAASALRYQR